ncbi:hypothetical protein P153DRAFT_258775, partial [Dothidotthia symphoricarpi CBS 119687]
YLSAASFPFDVAFGPPTNPFPSSDLTLNALVQHGVHMMDCDRAFLSLIDNRSQFVCAEMTRDQPLVRQNPLQPLLLGISRIALEWGVCPYTMSIFHGKTDVALPETPYIVADKSYFCIKDFRRIPSFAERPYVVGYPHMVSYIEVPLHSLSGHIIGSYCVVDNKSRDFLAPKALDTIRDVTQAISSYLNTKRVEASRTRSERMMDGLRFFVGSDRHVPSLGHGTIETGGAQAGPFDLNVFSQTPRMGLNSSADESVENDRPMDANRDRGILADLTDDVSRCSIGLLSLTSEPSATITPDDTPTPPETTDSISPWESTLYNFEDESLQPTIQGPNASERATLDMSYHINKLFTKAANVIGYALNLDGLVFFDTISTDAQYAGSRSSSSFTVDGIVEPMTPGDSLLAMPLSEYRCDDGALEEIIRKPSQSTIQRLTDRYPQGHVFAMDEYGVLDYESDHDGDDHQDPSGGSVVDSDWKDLLECVPKARYAVFLPLWHYQRESCFATCLVWVSDTAKTLNSNDVNSLTAFGNSLMVEILRLEASTNTQSKSDFVSSISHELRSPLHGILATVELIQETTNDPHLLSMVEMIESCSSTLLDTFDHLLEFARINSRAHNAQSAKTDRPKNSPSNTPLEKEVVDLGTLVEDVLEVVSLGHSSAMQMESGLKREQQDASASRIQINPSRSLFITTYIEKNRDWMMSVETGAWKRILLCIFSNAFKFTDTGYIDVSLRISKKANNSPEHISVCVTDTGIGMSHEFLKYHLFTPFMQENNLSLGNGLGLSIAKSLVESLGGKIFVESRHHEGTRVTFNIPFEQIVESSTNPIIHSAGIPEDKLQNLSLGLISIALGKPKTTERTPRIVSPPKMLQRSIRNICEGMLGMKIANISENTMPQTDLILLDTHTLTTTDDLNLEKLFSKDSLQTILPPIVVLGTPVKGLLQFLGVEKITCINSPITERKVRTAFLTALNATSDKEAMSTISISDTAGQGACHQVAQISVTDVHQEDNSTAAHSERSGLHSDDRLHQVAPDVEKEALEQLCQPQTSPLQEATTIEPVSRPNVVSRFRRFLLVDDNPINLKVLAAFAKRIGRPFSTAPDGAEAVRLYQKAVLEEEDPFDCVFMDISMPVMDGFQAVAAIRRLEKRQQEEQESQDSHNVDSDRKISTTTPRSYILALTGLGSEQARNTAKSSGFDEYLLKPVKFKDILPLLRPL